VVGREAVTAVRPALLPYGHAFAELEHRDRFDPAWPVGDPFGRQPSHQKDMIEEARIQGRKNRFLETMVNATTLAKLLPIG
jgi:hypothetical protein